MIEELIYRKATIQDLQAIIALLTEDDLSKTREQLESAPAQSYIDAFHKINKDPNQYLMVVEYNSEVIGTCQLTIIPSLTFKGSTRMQIEAVHIAGKYRSQKIGQYMINRAIDYAKEQGASIIQLTSNKIRLRAKKFYENLGFKATHEGMKLYL